MRPVRLEMSGFASFRAETVVDFDGADYFALTGPTGSGKSTVIDAMTFALYGSAPRWGRSNSVQYALAPTTTRATVRLVFDVGSERYRVAREIRRTGRTIAQKTATLERLDDPTTADATTDEVQVLASEVREVTPAVEELLGLSFDDFTKAVVLPQGRFAEFLGATVGERQEILLKLLGAHQYDIVMRAAGERRRAAEAEVTASDARIDELGGATQEAAEAAAAEHRSLTALGVRVETLAREAGAARAAATQAGSAVVAAERDGERLSAVAIPEGVAGLAERAARSQAEGRRLRLEADDAEKAYADARDALQSAGQRSHLERLRDSYAEKATLTGALASLRSAAGEAEGAVRRAADDRGRAERVWADSVEEESRAGQAVDAASAEVAAVTGRRSQIAALTAPDGLADLAQRLTSAQEAVTAASERRAAAEQAEDEARAAMDACPDAFDLGAQITRYDAAIDLTATVADLEAKKAAAATALAASREAARVADAALATARQSADEAQVRVTAAGLRAHLELGEACPVCTATVVSLPEPLDASEAVDATGAVHRAEAAARSAGAVLARAEGDLANLTSDLHSARERLSPLAGEGGDLAELRARAMASLEAGRAASARLATAGSARREAVTLLREAEQVAERLTAERRTGFAALRAERARLLPFGAPVAESDSLLDAWAELRAWAGNAVSELDAVAIPRADAELARAAEELTAAKGSVLAADLARRAAEGAVENAQAEALRAREALERAGVRIADLTARLDGAPPPGDIAAALEQLGALEARERESFSAFRAAAAARDRARVAQEAVRDELAAADRLLREIREPLVALGAPAVGASDLPGSWAAMATWAKGAVSQADAALASAVEREREAQRSADAAELALVTAAVDAGVEVGSAAQVEVAVATRIARAADRLASVLASLERIAELRSQRETAFEKEKVAGMLAEQLSAKKFQRWLAGAALDVLVEAASSSLLELSAGQFSLTHVKGEFYVIDHADAEAMRSVRTLSGGETFQASLALALALSAELSSMSSNAARLDSIFLDEGFGSLDPDSLEVVAVTLERLASGDRLVGVVTHVAALAERIPTRFAVARTSRTSTITRVQ